MSAQDYFLIPFSIFWCGFSIFWETMTFVGSAPFFFKLWGIPFVLIGLYLVLGRFFVDARRRARTFYGLTDRRAIIVVAGRTRSVKSIDLSTQQSIDLSESGDGRGTIQFGAASAHPGWGAGTSFPTRKGVPRFEGIRSARAVYQRALEAKHAAHGLAGN